MACPPPSSADQPNPTSSSTAPTYHPVGVFWDYGQPIFALPGVSELNPDRELPTAHQYPGVQARRQHPQSSKQVRGDQRLQGLLPTPRQISRAVLPPIRTSVLWSVSDRSVHLLHLSHPVLTSRSRLPAQWKQLGKLDDDRWVASTG
jgi:hypothetical protein